MKEKLCLNCKNPLTKRWQQKYCSNTCQFELKHKTYIDSWKSGKTNIKTKNVSRYLRRYLLETSGETCHLCGWGKKNPTTGKVPLEIDHIDGNHKNNSPQNLRLLCPNCHALTPTFRNLNKGNGRRWRNKS